ncbi:MAG: PP0621 family protein [Burkholderiaceae bacterium]
MGKLLSWVILIALVWIAFKLVQISQRKREAARRAAAQAFGGEGQGRDGAAGGGGQGAAGRRSFGEPMVQCAHCGVFMPRSTALTAGDRFYCDGEHQRLDRDRRN